MVDRNSGWKITCEEHNTGLTEVQESENGEEKNAYFISVSVYVEESPKYADTVFSFLQKKGLPLVCGHLGHAKL